MQNRIFFVPKSYSIVLIWLFFGLFKKKTAQVHINPGLTRQLLLLLLVSRGIFYNCKKKSLKKSKIRWPIKTPKEDKPAHFAIPLPGANGEDAPMEKMRLSASPAETPCKS